MDDLQDAIQDAQFIGEMSDPTPRPTRPLDLPSESEAVAWAEMMRSTGDGRDVSAEAVLGQPLGFYLFGRYLREQDATGVTGASAHEALAFVEAVAAYSAIRKAGLRLRAAGEMRHRFLRAPPREVDLVVDPSGAADATGPTRAPALAAVQPQFSVPGTTERDTSVLGAIVGSSSPPSRRSPTASALPGGAAAAKRRGGGIVRLESSVSVSATSAAQSVLFSEAGPPSIIRARTDGGGVRLRAAKKLYSEYADPSAPLGISGAPLQKLRDEIDKRVSRRLSRHGYLQTPHNIKPSKVKQAVVATGGAGGAGGSSSGNGAPIADEAAYATSTAVSDGRLLTVSSVDTETKAEAGESSTGRSGPSDSGSALPSDFFNSVGDAVLEGLLACYWKPFVTSPLFVHFCQLKMCETRAVGEDDFAVFRILGRGGFGAVNACKKADTGRLFAMKLLSKRRIKARGAEELCINERRVFAMVHSPFVVQMRYAYATRDDLVLVLDLMTGGDLAFHLNRATRSGSSGAFSERRAVFHAAECALGLAHLHSLGVVYRDLKPENLLLDEEGHLRISDMGLAAKYTPTLVGRCGTRGYWAPEMLIKPGGKRQHYNYAVDWWSFGCVVYELLAGVCPFRSEAARRLDHDRHVAMDRATLELDVEYSPAIFSAEAEDLCRRLLQRDPTKRLGSGPSGAEEIKAHPWFDGIDWGLMATRQLQPPFVPDRNINAASQEAIGMFDELPAGQATLTDEDHARYAGWDAVDAVAFQQEMVDFLAWEEQEGAVPVAPVSDGCCAIS